MDYEKKYKELVGQIKKAHLYAQTDSTKAVFEDILPELKESEEERIRKALIRFHKSTIDVDGIKGSDIVAWLEKQGEQKITDKYNIRGIKSKHAKGKLGEMIKEMKSVDKVEPKFRKGDWVVYCNDDVDLITGIEEKGYCINNGGYIPFICENEMRLWDITDAKVGDVLVSESTCGLGTWYCIFKSLDGDESMTVYCYLARDGRFETKKELCFDKDPYNTNPATKEQRDRLEKAMANAGYKWDAEKKELKKIEQKPTEWSDEDEEYLRRAINAMKDTHPKTTDWLKALKERVACEANCTTTKQWKPSEEQVKVLEFFIPYVTKCSIVLQKSKDTLLSLLADLKKLREE